MYHGGLGIRLLKVLKSTFYLVLSLVKAFADPITKISRTKLRYNGLECSDWLFSSFKPIRALQTIVEEFYAGK